MPFGFSLDPRQTSRRATRNQQRSSTRPRDDDEDVFQYYSDEDPSLDDDDDDDSDEYDHQESASARLLPTSSSHAPPSSASRKGKSSSRSYLPPHSHTSIRLEEMYQTPTLKRSFSSKRILSRRYSDSDEEPRSPDPAQDGSSPSDPAAGGEAGADGAAAGPSTPRRPGSSRRSRSQRRSFHRPSELAAAEAGEAEEPAWVQGFELDRSAKENKSLAVSAELDEMGMGRYQWYIFFLCGLGFFIDLLWAQMFGLITVPLRSETGFGASSENIGTLSTAFNVGLTVGAFCWGIGVDIVGRKWSFYLTCLIAGIFGISSGAPDTFTGLRVLVAFTGFGVGGNIPIDCTITLEFLPTQRHYLLALLSVFQPIGTLAASGIAYGFIPKYSCGGGEAQVNGLCTRDENSGWRYAIYTIGGITLGVFFIRFLVFKFRESPSYLINRGHDEQALSVLYEIARVNKAKKPRLTMGDFKLIEERCKRHQLGLDEEGEEGSTANRSAESGDPFAAPAGTSSRPISTIIHGDGEEKAEDDYANETTAQTFKRTMREARAQFSMAGLLFKDRKMARITILLWLTYMADFFGFNIAGVFLPLILSDRGVVAGQTLSETYRDYVAIYAPGIAACLLACALIEVPRVGRQYVMVISSALMGISLFLYTKVTSQAGSVGLNAMEYFFQSLFNAVLYAVVPEFYPSAVRGTAAGLTSTLGRISGIIAPLAGQSLYGANGGTAEGATRTLYMGGGVILICPLALILLPYDTRGKRSY